MSEDQSVASTDAGTDDDIGDVTDANGEVIAVGAVGACILDVANVVIGAVDAEGAAAEVGAEDVAEVVAEAEDAVDAQDAANDEDAAEDEDAEGADEVAEDAAGCYGCC